MIQKFIFGFLLLFSMEIIAQKKQELGVFSEENTWGKEILKFPLGFAREIPFEGFADIRFHKDWIKKDKAGFWSYLFAWHVKGSQKPTIQNLENYMKLYYDGLVDGKRKDIPQSMVLFIKSNSLDTDHIGKIKVFDRFVTNKVISLNVLVKTFYCKEKRTSTILFRVSPQSFNHKIWNELYDVKLKENLCIE